MAARPVELTHEIVLVRLGGPPLKVRFVQKAKGLRPFSVFSAGHVGGSLRHIGFQNNVGVSEKL